MEYTITYLNSKEEETELTIEVEYSSYYDGIGYYEYGSEKCFDKGQLCVDIDNIIYDKTGLSEQDLINIQEQINQDTESIINACLQDIKDRKEVAAEKDYDDWKIY
jgi:hypothetical protein